jgi:hypothetical protein|uniref:Uncharacterized protein n=1 Tax=viral metagenome TaxID=1070528 RepID=A0A6C0CWX7_9ZZZZ
MCFSERASIVSFFFGIIGSLLLISLGGVNNKIIGYYFIYISFMQIIDFLLWRHQVCDDYNRIISFLGMLLNNSQPIVLGMIILLFNPIHQNIILTLMLLYLCFVIPYSLPFVTNKKLQCTLKGKENHLVWNWNLLKYSTMIYFIYLLTVCGLFIYGLTNFKIGFFVAFIAIITYVTSLFIYTPKYVGTIWCYYAVFLPILSYLIQYYKIIKL